MESETTAERFIEALETHRSAEELRKIQRYFKTGEGEYGAGDEFMGVRMGTVFETAKVFIDMPPAEIEKLLESAIHEVRAGALSIMAKQAALRTTTEARRKELYELYLRRHDRINNWDLVDLAAWHVVGRYLADKPRDTLYRLAASDNLWERRTAILSTMHFIKGNDVEDTFRLAEMLVNDPHDLIHKATGWALREAGKKDPARLFAFLNRYAVTMPRTLLRYAIERLDKTERDRYMKLGKTP